MEALKVTGTQTFMNQEIPVILGGFGEGKRCISDKTIAEIHGVTTSDVRKMTIRNMNRFIVNIDVLDFKRSSSDDDLDKLLQMLGYSRQQIIQAEHVFIYSERGYAKLIKIMDSDLAWEIHDKLIDEYFILREEKKQAQKVESDKTKEMLAEAKLKNAKVREANILLKIAERVDIPTYQQIMYSKATEVLFDEMILPLPKAERKTYSATEIGEQLGISANKVGKIANANNLKTAEYGERVWDKSQHSNKQVETWRYYDSVLPVLEKFLRTKECDGSGV